MRPIEGSVDIDRPPQEVFAYISDVRHLPQWQPDVQGAALDDGVAVAVGAPGHERRRVGGAVRTVPFVVSDCAPGRRWAVQGTGGPVRAHVSMDISALGGGSASRLRYAIDPVGHGAGVVLALLARPGIRRAVPANLVRLKDQVERGG